jgi:hypothetical protein
VEKSREEKPQVHRNQYREREELLMIYHDLSYLSMAPRHQCRRNPNDTLLVEGKQKEE